MSPVTPFMHNRGLTVAKYRLALTVLSLQFATAFPAQNVPRNQDDRIVAQADLPRRVSDAMEARASGEPIRIARASERVLSLALVQMAKFRLDAKEYANAFELCRQSLEFVDSDQTRVEMAIVGLYARKSDDAVAQASAAVSLNPANNLAWTVKGEALSQISDYRGAIESLQRALEIKRDTESLYAIGMAYLGAGDQRKAQEMFSEVLARAGDAGWSRILIGRAYEEQQLYREAIEQYKVALRIDPRARDAHYQWAHALLRANDWSPTPEVRYQLMEELKLDQRHLLANYLLGVFESIERNYSASDRYLRVASELAPRLPEIWMYLGLNANARGDKQSAEKNFRRSIVLRERGTGPSGHLTIRKSYIALGRLLVLSGRKEEGEKFLNAAQKMQLADLADRREKVASIKSEEGTGVAGAIESDLSEADRQSPRTFGPSYLVSDLPRTTFGRRATQNVLPPADRAAVTRLTALLGSSFNDLATAEAFERQFDLALKHYLSARDWDPNIPGLSRNLGLAYFYAGQPANAISVLQPVVARTPSDVQATSVLAQCYFAEKNYVKTAHLVNLISAEVEKDPLVNFIWAKSLAKVGRRRDAVLALKRAEKMRSGNDIQFLLDCGKLWDELSEHERAERCFRAVLSLDPGNVTARQALSISDSGVAEPK